jgi:hypothetical protein
MSPKVWWISLGGGGPSQDDDIMTNECAWNVIQAEIALLVQRITKEQPQARIVLSPPPSTRTLATGFHKRLECIASASSNGSPIEYYNPFRVHQDTEQDDDFFMDVSSSTTTKAVLTMQESQQAVVLKLQKLLH